MGKLTHTFTFPEDMRYDGGPATVGMRALTVAEELAASAAGRLDAMRTQYEAVKISIRELDGRAADQKQVELFFEACGTKCRTLLVQAYDHVSSPKARALDDFLKSEEVKAG